MRAGRNRVFAGLAMGVIAFAGTLACPVWAQGAARVVELFTSQGCSKCPPADRLIASFAKEPGTIALSFAVNYWDYIGWKDTLASSAFTRRQHAYAAARGDGLVYTPQVVVDGLEARPGADEAAILHMGETLKGHGGALSVPISLTEANGRLRIDLGPGPQTRPVGIYVLRVERTKTVEIGRGENSGRSITYTNVVRAMNRIGEWTGAAQQFDVLELKGEGEGYVVLLQAGTPDKPGAILAAAKTADL